MTDEAGRDLGFVHTRDEVIIQLREAAAPDKPVKVRFELDGDFLVHPGGDSYWELGIGTWFPQPEICEQAYTFHSVVRVKKPFLPFATGKTVRRAVEGDDNVLETREENPIAFAVVMAGDYTSKEEVRDGVTIRVSTYALKNDRAVKQLTDLSASIIKFYTVFLGAFPFAELNIIEISDFGFGQAPPGFMFITKEAFNPLATAESQEYSGGVNERFAHEIAHQYWGYAVREASVEDEWLSESFAEYSAALFLQDRQGGVDVQDARRQLEGQSAVRRRRGADPARQPGPELERLHDAERHPLRAPLRQGATAAGRAPPTARRRRLLHLFQVLPEVVPLEVRIHEEGGGAPEFHDETGLRPLLRSELLGPGDAQGLALPNGRIVPGGRAARRRRAGALRGRAVARAADSRRAPGRLRAPRLPAVSPRLHWEAERRCRSITCRSRTPGCRSAAPSRTTPI